MDVVSMTDVVTDNLLGYEQVLEVELANSVRSVQLATCLRSDVTLLRD